MSESFPVNTLAPLQTDGPLPAIEGNSISSDLIKGLEAIEGSKIFFDEEAQHHPVCDGKAEVLTGVELGGMLHISSGIIEQFDPAKSGSNGGKFGSGTYFGLGPLKGETASGLFQRMEEGKAYGHETKVKGNFLVLRQDDIKEVEEQLVKEAGQVRSPRLKTSIKNAPLADLVQRAPLGDEPIDGVIIIMGQEQRAAEVVIVPSSTSKLQIEGIRSGGESTRVLGGFEPKPRIPKQELEEAIESGELPEPLRRQVSALVGEHPPLDMEEVVSIEGATAAAVLNNDLQRQMLVKRFGDLMDMPVGVGEGYTLGEHTQMVLSIFEEQFADDLSDYDVELTRILRTTLLLQDIGKPLSLALHENTAQQSAYNHDLAEVYLENFDFSPEVKTMMAELIGQDVLGTYFKQAGFDLAEKGKGLNQAVSSLRGLAERIGLPASDVLNFLEILYISDAAAYTSWSEYVDSNGAHRKGRASLESLFVRDEATGKISLSPRLARASSRLREALSN